MVVLILRFHGTYLYQAIEGSCLGDNLGLSAVGGSYDCNLGRWRRNSLKKSIHRLSNRVLQQSRVWICIYNGPIQ